METILFLIIVGILSSIFGKRGKRNQGPLKPFTAKGFDDYRTKVEQQIGKKPEQTTTGKPIISEPPPLSMEQKYQGIKLTSVVSSEQEGPMKYMESTDDDPLNKLEEKTIINGIIWAEILGEPRAKKPYNSRKC